MYYTRMKMRGHEQQLYFLLFSTIIDGLFKSSKDREIVCIRRECKETIRIFKQKYKQKMIKEVFSFNLVR